MTLYFYAFVMYPYLLNKIIILYHTGLAVFDMACEIDLMTETLTTLTQVQQRSTLFDLKQIH